MKLRIIGAAAVALLLCSLVVFGAGTPIDNANSTSTAVIVAANGQATVRYGTAIVQTTQTAAAGHDHGTCSGAGLWTAPGVDGAEHGDAPPQWIMDAGYTVCFDGPFNTSPLENTAKHAAMKGFLITNIAGTGQDLYFRIHAASNPGDRQARYHSFEWWMRGTDGKVSHESGWYDSGAPTVYPGGARIPRKQFGDPGVRGSILVVDHASYDAGIRFEQWYPTPGQADWYADFGWTIGESTTFYHTDENANPDIYNAATWDKTGNLGLTRRLEFAWYANRSAQRGDFYSDQFGGLLSGPTDPRVGTPIVKFGVTYTVVALHQHLESTLKTVQFPGNAVQRVFPGTGVHLPN